MVSWELMTYETSTVLEWFALAGDQLQVVPDCYHIDGDLLVVALDWYDLLHMVLDWYHIAGDLLLVVLDRYPVSGGLLQVVLDWYLVSGYLNRWC